MNCFRLLYFPTVCCPVSKILFVIISFVFLLLLSLPSNSQTLWTGPSIIFEKADYVDFTIPENQDRITNLVWITRDENGGIFNIRQEDSFDRVNRTSPLGTEWANGKISEGIENLEFTTWFESKTGSSTMEVGKDKVLHIIAEDIYIDVKVLSWTPGGGGSGTGFGGGFSYERSTPDISFVEDTEQTGFELSVLNDYTLISSELSIFSVEVITLKGNIIKSIESIASQGTYQFYTGDLPTGIYLIRINGSYMIKLSY